MFLLLNVAFYWGLVPSLLTAAGVRLDRLTGTSPVPPWIGLPLGAVLIGAGALGALWSTVALYLRGGGFPIALMPPKRLVRAGPYAISRHPLYLSFAVYLLGWGLVARSPIAVAIAPIVTLVLGLYALFHEERVLGRRFGEEYEGYRRDVPFLLRPRRGVPGPGILFSLAYLIGKPIVRLLFPIEVEGKEDLPQAGPLLLIANHASYLDPIFLIAAADRYIRFLTKGEMLSTRFGRWFFTRTGAIPTDRYRIDPASVRRLLSALKAGEIVGMFPEGERTWDGRPLPIHPTVQRLLSRAGVPIVAARIEGSYALYPRWAGNPLPGGLKVHFSSPVPPSGVQEALSQIAVVSVGRTWMARKALGIERLLWACPSCRTIGGIIGQGYKIICRNCHEQWRLDKDLHVRERGGKAVPFVQFVSFLDGDLLGELDTLTSIGDVELLVGREELWPVATGIITYRDGALHLGNRAFPLDEARIIRLEGRKRLDIGFPNSERIRLCFQQDSPLKWARFLRLRLGIDA